MVINSDQQYALSAYDMLNMLFTIVTNTEEKQAMVLALKNIADLLRDKMYVCLLSQRQCFVQEWCKKYECIG